MTVTDFLLLLALAAIWGASFLFIKVAVLEISPLALVAARLALGALGLLGFLALARVLPSGRERERDPFPLSDPRLWLRSPLIALFGAVIPWLLIAWGELHISSGAAAILNATSPIFSAAFGHWLALWGQEEEMSGARALGLGLGIAGVVVLVTGSPGFQALQGSGLPEVLGYVAVVAASASYAVGGLYARIAFAGLSHIYPALGQSLLGALVMVPLAALIARPAGLPSAAASGSVLALGIGGTALAYIIYYRLLSRVGATRTLSVTYLLPASALIYGALLLSEEVRWSMLLGLALILAGVTLTTGVLRFRAAGASTR